MTHACPSCGYNLSRDEVISTDGFMLDPRGVVSFGGRGIDITSGEAMLLHTIASEQGRVLRAETIGQRISDSDDPGNVAQVTVCRVRQKLRDAALPVPFHNVRGRGYAWGLA